PTPSSQQRGKQHDDDGDHDTPARQGPAEEEARPQRPLGRPAGQPWPGGVLTMTIGKEVTHYFAWPIATDYGEGWAVQKFNQPGDPPGTQHPTYHVNLDRQHGRNSCDCLGHLHHGHCKHVDAMLALTAR